MMYAIRKFDEPRVSYKSKILENTFNIDKEVDYIYDTYIDDFIKNFSISSYRPFGRSKFLISDEFLFSPDVKKAHSISPVSIEISVDNQAPFYDSRLNIIKIEINQEAIDLIVKYKFDWSLIKSVLSLKDYNTIINEITPKRIKATIYHELSHWLRHTLFDSPKEGSRYKQDNVNMVYFEIDAQIHGIQQLKREYSQSQWDSLSLAEVFQVYSSLYVIASDLRNHYGDRQVLDWLQNLVKRMSREGLLGKNMRIEDVTNYIEKRKETERYKI